MAELDLKQTGRKVEKSPSFTSRRPTYLPTPLPTELPPTCHFGFRMKLIIALLYYLPCRCSIICANIFRGHHARSSNIINKKEGADGIVESITEESVGVLFMLYERYRISSSVW